MSGIAWAIASGLCFGLFQIINRRAGKQMQIYIATFILLAVSAVVLMLASLIFEDVGAVLKQATLASVAYFATAGLIHFFIGWTLFSTSQKRVGAARTSVLLGTVPLFATVIGIVFFGEFLSMITLVGIFLVVAGVYVVATA